MFSMPEEMPPRVLVQDGTPMPLPRLTIATMAFLTVVDLFAAQAILPSLTKHYAVMPSQMAVAVNSATIGMAVASLLVALFNQSIPRRAGIIGALLLLAVPTALLAHAPSLAVFTALRVIQGLLMASAFSLTLAYLGERIPSMQTGTAFAAYIAGNVASNLIGRFAAAAVTGSAGIEAAFYTLAALNLTGAMLAYRTFAPAPATVHQRDPRPAWSRISVHLANRKLATVFAIGFLILFAFIGTFSFINFALLKEPLNVSMSGIGVSYLVFTPSILTTLLAGSVANRIGARFALLAGFGIAAAGLPLVLAPALPAVLAGMTLIAIGTFFAQGVATAFASRIAGTDRAAASGLYLASYFLGGLAGAAILGAAFDAGGWQGCVAGVAMALAVAAALSLTLREQS